MSNARDMAGLSSVNDRLSEVGNSDGALSNRNMIINGAMQVWQRGTSFTAAGYHADRFSVDAAGAANFTYTRDSDAPAGFEYSTKITTSSSFTATSYQFYRYNIEGTDAARLALGTAGAKSFTLSFWVKSSLTGAFSIAFTNGANTYNYPTTYTINTANTWEYKTITASGATGGTWIKDASGTGLRIKWDLGSGLTYSGIPNTWFGFDRATVAGSVKLSETAGATLQITGVQLEVGDQSTPFEHRSYSDELQRCMRYFQVLKEGRLGGVINGTGHGIVFNQYIQPSMRSSPTTTVVGVPGIAYMSGSSQISSTVTGVTASGYKMNIVKANGSTGDGLSFWVDCTSSNNFTFDAEL